MIAPQPSASLATIAKLLAGVRDTLNKYHDVVTLNSADIGMMGGMIDAAAVLMNNLERERVTKAPAPNAGDWAKSIQTEHLNRAPRMVHGLTMADLVAFEDAEKAAQAGQHVDIKA